MTKNALKNAASIVGLLITVACMITDKKESKSSEMQGGMPGMGGMMPGMM